jgi:hypothetical protein
MGMVAMPSLVPLRSLLLPRSAHTSAARFEVNALGLVQIVAPIFGVALRGGVFFAQYSLSDRHA